MKIETIKMRTTLILAGALCLASYSSDAGTHVWSGAGPNKNWNTAANWSQGGVPNTSEAQCFIVFPNAVTGPSTNNIPGLRVDRIAFLGSGVSIQGTPGVSLTLKGTAGTNIYSAGMNYIFGTLPIVLEGTNRLQSAVGLGLYTRLSGAGAIETYGNVRLDGEVANVFTGPTIVKSGLLTLGKEVLPVGDPLGLVSVAGPLIIEEGTVSYASDNGIANSSLVEIQPGGTLNLNGRDDTVGELRLKGGTVQTGQGVLTLNGDVFASGNASISGKMSLGGLSRTFEVAAGKTLTIAATLSSGGQISTAGFSKTGAGRLVLSGANSYFGHTAVNLGTLELRHNAALGTSFISSTSVGQGAVLELADDVIVTGETLNLFNGTLSCSGTGAWVGPVSLNGACILQTTVAGGELALTGVISGEGALECSGLGRILMAGTNSNTYTGTTTLIGGSLYLAKSDDASAIHGNVVVGSPFHTNNAELLYVQEDHQIQDNVSITVLSSGRITMNNVVEKIGALALRGGEIHTGLGQLQLAGDLNVLASSQPSIISGELSLQGLERVFHVQESDTWPALEVSARISGAASAALRLTGEGSTLFSGNNTYSGPTTLAAGELVIDHPNALGADWTDANGTTVDSGATLNIIAPNGVVGETLRLSGVGAFGNGALIAQCSSLVWGGEVTLLGDSTINVVTLKQLSITNRISGTGGLTKVGGGTLTFGGNISNNYDGQTEVRSGTLSLAKGTGYRGMIDNVRVGATNGGLATLRCLSDQQFPSTRTLTLGPAGVFDMANRAQTVGRLNGAGEVRLGVSGLLQTYGGEYEGVITGNGGSLRVQDSLGGLRLKGTNTFTGPTIVDNAWLWVDGAIPGAVHVLPGGRLAGKGSVGSTDCSSGLVSPGIGFYDTATLKLKSLVLTNGSTFRLETRAHPAGGWERDQAEVDGVVNLNGATLDLKLGAAGTNNIGYMLIKNAGNDPIQGTFSGLPEGATFTQDGAQFQITYQSGDGNDVVLKQLSASTNVYDVKLSIAPYHTNWVRLSWPSFAGNYRVQSSTNYNGPQWVTYSHLDGNDGSKCWVNVFRNKADSASRFYRLVLESQ